MIGSNIVVCDYCVIVVHDDQVVVLDTTGVDNAEDDTLKSDWHCK